MWRRSCYRRYGFDRIAAAGLIILAVLTIGYCVNWIYVHHLFVRLTNEGGGGGDYRDHGGAPSLFAPAARA